MWEWRGGDTVKGCLGGTTHRAVRPAGCEGEKEGRVKDDTVLDLATG